MLVRNQISSSRCFLRESKSRSLSQRCHRAPTRLLTNLVLDFPVCVEVVRSRAPHNLDQLHHFDHGAGILGRERGSLRCAHEVLLVGHQTRVIVTRHVIHGFLDLGRPSSLPRRHTTQIKDL